MRDCQAAEEDGRRFALVATEHLRVGIVPVIDRLVVDAQTPAFLGFEQPQFALDRVVVQQALAHGVISLGAPRWNTMALISGGGGAMSRRTNFVSLMPAGTTVSSSR